MNTQGDRRHDGCADDHLVYLPYYPPHDRRAARIKERCADNAIGLDGQRWCRCVWQPQVQSTVDVLGGPPATMREAYVQLNLTRQIVKMAMKIDCRLLATSDPIVTLQSSINAGKKIK